VIGNTAPLGGGIANQGTLNDLNSPVRTTTPPQAAASPIKLH